VEEHRDYFARLVELMDVLRGPDGCPWDREQTRETLKPMLIEEAYELLEALDQDDPDSLCEELGDLLFHVIFHSRIASEKGEFDAYEVCRRVYEKMVRRHPHVFGEDIIEDSEELLRRWDDIKAAEKEASGRNAARRDSLLDGLPADLPTLYKSYSITERASRVGFDWPNLRGIRAKLDEEFEELEEAIAAGDSRRVKEEVGDLVFTALNVARYLEVDPETSLRSANSRFVQRFQSMEQVFQKQGRSLKDALPEEMEQVWKTVKNGGEPDSGDGD
jgi:tetrapyrrole methylase family protein / MazG family protein